MLKKDNLYFGLILGFLAPVLGMLGFYFWKFRSIAFGEFLAYMLQWKSLLTSVVSVSLIANAVVFTIYINKHIDKTARGIFIATCIYALITAGIKFWA